VARGNSRVVDGARAVGPRDARCPSIGTVYGPAVAKRGESNNVGARRRAARAVGQRLSEPLNCWHPGGASPEPDAIYQATGGAKAYSGDVARS
jgi:hypothetical protein